MFYTLKPAIPRRLQIFFRRQLATYKRKKYAHIWPIDPHSAKPPDGWQGWPDGKQFALVLSHDVDSKKGYENVLKLAELEEKLGFRSTFNFVPERYGKISLDLLNELKRRGFGVGVHGLKHDGKLFFSKNLFERRAQRINCYLEKWGTRGFTSPSMHHNLDWINSLNIDYSLSTFDTDPFEPQPNGLRTIFPYPVKDPRGNIKFIELPYTLPQDFTVLIIFKEQDTDLWKKKIAWIIERRGMALLNTHTDYMCFENHNPKYDEYHVEIYLSLLVHIKENYKGKYHHALSYEIAEYIKTISRNHCNINRKKVCN